MKNGFNLKLIEILDPWLQNNLGHNRFFSSLEGENPGGSIKDHIVHGELQDLVSRGSLKAGDRVSEVSAGSTARSLAVICKKMNLKCSLFLPKDLPVDQVQFLREQNAELFLVDRERAYDEHRKFCKAEKTHAFNQLGDSSLKRHYKNFGRELCEAAGPIQILIGAVGTGHSLKGTSEALATRARTITAEPANQAVPGIRNIESQRYGPDDACTASWFDQRVVLAESEVFPSRKMSSDKGLVQISESFQLVLGAAKKIADEVKNINFFLVGAANAKV
jgi:cysteine synthase